MATPTASNSALPSSATKKATGRVSTPQNHFGFSSPAPRSVPSPSATRKDHAGKTPTNHPTTGSSQGSKTLSSTPMMQNLSQQGNTLGSSPAANMLGTYGTPPIGLGVDGMTPSALNLSTPVLGGMAMAPSFSELGLTSSLSGSKPSEDEQRKARMRRVLRRIGTRSGRVSEEGIARASRRVGFTNDIDAEQLSREQQERVVGNRKVAIAGNKVLVEVDMKNHVPQSAEVMYDTESTHLADQAGSAGKLLLRDLQMSEEETIYTSLDRFAANLDRLARIDRLSSDHVNCFEALSGLYTSLRRLYQAQTEATDELVAMCRYGGKPTMHANGRLGMAIDYWRMNKTFNADARSNAIDLDSEDVNHGSDDDMFRLHIEVERSHAALYPSIRVSDLWLPLSLELDLKAVQSPPWQDPSPTMMGTTQESVKGIDDVSDHKLPDLRFVAKLEPPVVMPWQVASAIMQSCGLPGVQPFMTWPTWHSIILDRDLPITGTAANAAVSQADQTITALHDGQEFEVVHSYSLDVAKPEIAVKLQELQFSHPRQLVEALPLLRQWACFGTLMRQALATSLPQQPVGVTVSTNETTKGISSSLSLEDLLGSSVEPSSTQAETGDGKVPVSVVLTTSPTPTLDLTFPSKAGTTLTNVIVQVMSNAEYKVYRGDGVVGVANDASPDDTVGLNEGRLASALDSCGDLGVWVEWLRQQ